jgi:hypothetical protein
MTAAEYEKWQREHTVSQPQLNEQLAEEAYRKYCDFARRTGAAILPREQYELSLRLVGFKSDSDYN